MLSNEEEEGKKYEEVQAWGHRHQQMYIATVFVDKHWFCAQAIEKSRPPRYFTIFNKLSHTFAELKIVKGNS